jgi:hypothetical protein
MSSASAPVLIAAMAGRSCWPKRMIEPRPKLFFDLRPMPTPTLFLFHELLPFLAAPDRRKHRAGRANRCF